MYYASIEVDGVYRHRRPAMQALRKDMVRGCPGEYAHRLRDINNNPKITNQELLDVLDSVILKKKLTLELKKIK